MSMSNTSETALLNLLFRNQAWANIGDAGGLQPSAAAGSFFVALHSADPGETGSQTTNEIAYTGYSRIGAPRSGAFWDVSGAVVSNAAPVQFGECTAGSATVTHFSVGTAASGAGSIVYRGALGASRSISAGITPLFNIGALTGTVD
jgi:hypothetical protein